MEQRILNIERREKTGKGICRQLRVQELVPGVVYGKGFEPVTVTVNAKELQTVIAGEGGLNHLLTLNGGGLDGNTVIIAALLKDPIKGTLRHVDLHKVALTEKIKVQVAINLVGTPVGVKEGGLLDFAMHTIEVECLPNQIPEHIDVDATSLAIGQSLHVGDLHLPAGLKALGDMKASVISILGRAKEEAPAAAE